LAATAEGITDEEREALASGYLPGEIPVGSVGIMPQSSKVIPAQDDSYLDSDLDKEAQSPRLTEDGETDSIWVKIKSLPIITDLVLIWSVMSYDCLKDTTRYLLDTAQIKINVSFEDALMAMTLFVLFSQDIMVMAIQMSPAAGRSTLSIPYRR